MPLPGRCWLRVLLCLGMLFWAGNELRAQEAYLVTYGPGQEVWELFGHNAIWIRDLDRGIDHSFSFGYFELDRPGFYRDFARGIMPYYGSAGRIEREFEFYRGRDREIRIQRLNLSSEQVITLFDRLHQSIFPQPQYYDYDYYLANCSTRLRDLLDEITGGALAAQLKDRPAAKNFAEHTKALTAHRFFIYTGIQTLLGPMTDQPISVWDEAFLPERLAEALSEIELTRGPMVLDDRLEFESASVSGRFDAPGVWPIHLVLGALFLAVLFLAGVRGASDRAERSGSHRRFRVQGRAATIVSSIVATTVALAGVVIALMWTASGHEATWRNAMLLVLNPLWLLWLLPLSRPWQRRLWWLLLVCTLCGGFYLALPQGQFRPGILLWYLPVVGGLLWLSRPARPSERDSALPQE